MAPSFCGDHPSAIVASSLETSSGTIMQWKEMIQLSRTSCSGIVISLNGHTVALTGKVSIRGEHLFRPELISILVRKNAEYKDDVSRKVSLLVHGDLSSQLVVNEWEQHSQKLEQVKREAARGHHICVVSSRGLTSLVAGDTAKCHLWRYLNRREETDLPTRSRR